MCCQTPAESRITGVVATKASTKDIRQIAVAQNEEGTAVLLYEREELHDTDSFCLLDGIRIVPGEKVNAAGNWRKVLDISAGFPYNISRCIKELSCETA